MDEYCYCKYNLKMFKIPRSFNFFFKKCLLKKGRSKVCFFVSIFVLRDPLFPFITTLKHWSLEADFIADIYLLYFPSPVEGVMKKTKRGKRKKGKKEENGGKKGKRGKGEKLGKIVEDKGK